LTDFIYFYDPEAVINPDALNTLWTTLQNFEGCDFAYGFYHNITRKIYNIFDVCGAQDWNPGLLARFSFISPLSLVRRNKFLSFDSTLPRFEEWDLWLRMSKNGSIGRYTNSLIYKIFKKDPPADLFESLALIKKKHPELQI
jgi:hypothetical protein